MYQKKKTRPAETTDNDFRKGKVEIQRAGQDEKINGKLEEDMKKILMFWEKMESKKTKLIIYLPIQSLTSLIYVPIHLILCRV